MQLNDIEKRILTEALELFSKGKDPIIQDLTTQLLNRIIDPATRKPKSEN